MKLLDMQGKIYDAETAKRVAKQLQDGEADGWTYFVTVSADGKFGYVNCFDENGIFVGKW